MKLSNLVLREMEIYAMRVGLHDSEGLARFHQECTPERILAILEHVRKFEKNEDEIEDLKIDVEYYRDRCYDLEKELEDRKHDS